jgi:putative ABC transport system substrate-binding protein
MTAIVRRQFLVAAGAGLTAALVGSTYGRPPYRIGMLPDCEEPYCTLFDAAMRRQGWREGREFVLVKPGLRYGDRIDLAAERTAAAAPDLVYTIGTAYVIAMRRQSERIPIVMWASGYPVEAGLARSLARPGLNVTGLSLYAGTEVLGKLLEYLSEVRRDLGRVGVLWSYVPPIHPAAEVAPCYDALRTAGARLGLSIRIVDLAKPEGLAASLSELDAFAPQAVVVTSGTGVWPVRLEILRHAMARGWPTITDSPWRPDDELRPLLSYGPSSQSLIDLTVPYIVRILRDGVSPGELPIQQPAKFELAIHLATARTLGLEVPHQLLLRANVVQE